jgi:hypothetical protein
MGREATIREARPDGRFAELTAAVSILQGYGRSKESAQDIPLRTTSASSDLTESVSILAGR